MSEPPPPLRYIATAHPPTPEQQQAARAFVMGQADGAMLAEMLGIEAAE